jgi:hypothetical protein
LTRKGGGKRIEDKSVDASTQRAQVPLDDPIKIPWI